MLSSSEGISGDFNEFMESQQNMVRSNRICYFMFDVANKLRLLENIQSRVQLLMTRRSCAEYWATSTDWIEHVKYV